jgi:hypothetical protein
MNRKMLIWLLALLGAVSCTSVETSGGTLRIEFETGAVQTKAAEPDGVVADGGGIYFTGTGTNEDPYRPDLIIVVADENGIIQGKYIGTSASNTNSNLEGTPSSTKMSVSITGLTAPETYTVYAFANTLGLWTMKIGETTVSNLADALTGVSPVITTASQLEAIQFRPVAIDKDTYGCLAVKNGRLPLSAKGTVTLKASGNGEIALQLLRCVAKVTAVFENQYGEVLNLYDFSNTFFHMNPSTGYVVPHESDFPVEHDSPDDGDLAAEENYLQIPQDATISQFWYVFPSVGLYSCNISFFMDAERTPAQFKSYSNLQVHDDHARDIPQLARNQHLTITTRISKGTQVSFNFEVSDWDPKTETVTFN